MYKMLTKDSLGWKHSLSSSVFQVVSHFRIVFSMHKMNTEVLLSLMEVLKGPQDIELELKMTVFRDGQPAGTNVAKIFIFVSEYSY